MAPVLRKAEIRFQICKLASTGAITVIVVLGIVLSIVSSLYIVSSSSVSSLNSSLSTDQSQITFIENHPSTTTITTTSISTITKTTTYSTTYTTLETVTTTRSIYPPSSSSYILTFVSGNATCKLTLCCSFIYSVDVTYEIHSPTTNGVVVWVRYPTGEVAEASPTSFTNQAYLTLDAQFS